LNRIIYTYLTTKYRPKGETRSRRLQIIIDKCIFARKICTGYSKNVINYFATNTISVELDAFLKPRDGFSYTPVAASRSFRSVVRLRKCEDWRKPDGAESTDLENPPSTEIRQPLDTSRQVHRLSDRRSLRDQSFDFVDKSSGRHWRRSLPLLRSPLAFSRLGRGARTSRRWIPDEVLRSRKADDVAHSFQMIAATTQTTRCYLQIPNTGAEFVRTIFWPGLMWPYLAKSVEFLCLQKFF